MGGSFMSKEKKRKDHDHPAVDPSETYYSFRDGADGSNTQYLFIGSLNCLRHKPFANMGKIMQHGQGAILCPSMADFASGKYLVQLKEAIVELAQERKIKNFQLITGCQWTILSSDETMLVEELKNEHDITLRVYDEHHLDGKD